MKNQIEAEANLTLHREGFSTGRLTAKVDQSRRERERETITKPWANQKAGKKKKRKKHTTQLQARENHAKTSELVWLLPLIG